ncbi:TPA: hypothetical protein TZN93_001956 [Streptococcus suis]|uniref:Uncharacterized protein n=1 Tax=Streptococcus suis TaxID=1307 RepID=A0A0Z8EX16_STRSU|nr:hypothetical protein [Streptococcus suis]NQH22507.1 hypothetical protein [Streptococcus suis]NQH48584.1 hypothetical protein [Streptococcus suis]NQL70556.1 hypothetical protein [Streptococcus suis]NQN38310.1 hypothetical protein [Streptococcus suis]NQO74746.1 hypothetical protein [Streptococcus suis]
MENIVIEYNNALFINGYRVPYVLKDSVEIDKTTMQVTLTIAVSEYHRIKRQKEPVEVYKFKNDLPK